MIHFYNLYKITYLCLYFIVELAGHSEAYDIAYFSGLGMSRKFYPVPEYLQSTQLTPVSVILDA